MSYKEILEYFDSFKINSEFELTVSDSFPIAPFSYGQILTLSTNIDIFAGAIYLVIFNSNMFSANARLANNVLLLTDLNGNQYKFTEEDADKVAVLARILSVTF